MGWDTLVCGVATAAQEQSFLIFTRQLHFIYNISESEHQNIIVW